MFPGYKKAVYCGQDNDGLSVYREGKPSIECKCSERQLEQVGCECEEVKVWCWTKGYSGESFSFKASYKATQRELEDHAQSINYQARVYRVERKEAPRPVENFSPEYVRMMSQGG